MSQESLSSDPSEATESAPEEYDVVIIGGAIAGASTAVLLKRWHPTLSILIVERADAFNRKVGEATVEISSLFLTRALGLYDHLLRNHLPKHGLRYWFSNRAGRAFHEMSEVGLGTIPQLPSFELDRSILDQHVLDLASELGVHILRPAKVKDVALREPSKGSVNKLEIEVNGNTRTVSSRWVVDASGKTAYLAKRLGLLEKNDDHQTSAVWARFSGVKDMDGAAVMGSDPRNPNLPQLRCARRLATNHFCTRGSWTWLIPLSNGMTSVGTVFDKRLFELPEGDSTRERFLKFINQSSGLCDLLENAELDEGDFNYYEHLSYHTRQYMADGWAIVGDAAAFIDPYYSPGLDHVSFSVYASARIIDEQLSGKLEGAALSDRIALHNREFERSFQHYYRALYKDKYEILGDAELSAASYLLDTSMYFMGVVGPAYRDIEELRRPVLGQTNWGARFASFLLSTYNRRLVKLARARIANGTYGRKNEGWRCIGGDFGVGTKSPNRAFFAGLRLWLVAEFDVLRRRFNRPRGDATSDTQQSGTLSENRA